MRKVEFKSGAAMLDFLSGADLYNIVTGEYVFRYNEEGSIAVYSFGMDKAISLAHQSQGKDYWSAFLGLGGYIYDDPSHELYNEDRISNLDYCKAICSEGIWMVADPTFLEEEVVDCVDETGNS